MAAVGFFLISVVGLLCVPLLPRVDGQYVTREVCLDRCARPTMCGTSTRVDTWQTSITNVPVTAGALVLARYTRCNCVCIMSGNGRQTKYCAVNAPANIPTFNRPASCPNRKRTLEEDPTDLHVAPRSVSVREEQPSPAASSSQLHQVSGFSINEDWFLTRIHDEAKLYDGSQIDCSVGMCSNCPFYGYVSLATCGMPNKTAMWEYAPDVNNIWEIFKPANEEIPILICTALVEVPANAAKASLLENSDPGFSLVSANEKTDLPVESGYKVREVTMNINIVGVLNQEAFWALGENCSIDEGELVNSFDLKPGTEDATTKKRAISTEGSYTFSVKSSLTQAQFNLLSQSIPISGAAFVPAASSGVAAGTIVGAVIGSVAGAVLLTAVVGGAAVAGRTYIVRRRRNLNPDAPALDAPTEMEDVSSPIDQQNELEDSSDQPKPSRFSVKVMGNREHAGSLTMRNPTAV